MSKRLVVINIVYAITDTIIAALSIIAFAWSSYFFKNWWILLLIIIPLALFNTHTLVIDSDIQKVKVDALKPDGGN